MLDYDTMMSKMLDDPYPIYRMLREQAPVVHIEELDLWLVSRYIDVRRILTDPNFSSDVRNGVSLLGATDVAPDDADLAGLMEQTMLLSDPPDHTRRRAPLAHAFTPRIVRGLGERIQQTVDALLDGVAEAGQMDLIADFAHPLPVEIIAELLGLPLEDREHFRAWSDDLIVWNDPTRTVEERTLALKSLPDVRDYFTELFEERRRQPRNDLTSTLLAAAEPHGCLSPKELLANTLLLLTAGHETLTSLIANAVLALDENPDERARLQQSPDLWPTAIEELLRYVGPVQLMQRQTLEACEIGGVQLAKATVVMPIHASANRDSEVFERAEQLVLDRDPNPHLAFGLGRHHCLGATLARSEARIALESLLGRFPDLVVDRDRVERRPAILVRGAKHVGVSFTPARRRTDAERRSRIGQASGASLS